MMGHLGTSYATSLSSSVTMATRYQFNIFSYDSDLSVGIDFRPPEQRNVLKAKFSLKDGIGMKIEGRYQRILYSLGLMTELKQNPKKTVGIEIQIV
ncbi:Mitochondrial distribution and morphology protein 10 [Phlyctochytrium planicorne]|nr:Mitochondrial distribution and morphology protein 10 [Phlyctochytrium planicorne]